MQELVMECGCGAEIESWRDECEDCELADVMRGPSYRGRNRGSNRTNRDSLRSHLPSKMGHDLELYVLRWKKRGLVKIGATSNLVQRKKDLERLAGEPLDLVVRVPLNSLGSEIGFHSDMNDAPEKFSGEWYHWTPRIETLIQKLQAA